MQWGMNCLWAPWQCWAVLLAGTAGRAPWWALLGGGLPCSPLRFVPVNFQALIIAMSVVGGSIILGICYCCCCWRRRRRRAREPDKQEEKAIREREERRVRQEER